jgi:signal peptidase I
MINTLAYGAALGPWVITRSPLRQGDIIAFERRDGDESRTYLKRIVALAGDTISMHDGSVIVNGARVVWPGAVLADHWNMRSSVIPVGAVFVLGDNRGESNDSRSFGPVPQASIIGKALLIIWPIGNIRPI